MNPLLTWIIADYSTKHSPRSPFYGEKPLMVAPSALGALFVLDGLVLLALAAALIGLAAQGLRRSEREMLSGGAAMYPSPESKIGRKPPA